MENPDDIAPPPSVSFIRDRPPPLQTSPIRLRPTTLQPWIKGGPAASTGTVQVISNDKQNPAERWRVPTILVLTVSIALGIAMMLFLMWVAYRKVKKLRTLRRQEMASTERRGYGIGRERI